MQQTKIVAAIALLFSATSLFAQRSRINTAINRLNRVTLQGHLQPKAAAEDDQGPVSPSLQLSRVTLMFKPSDSQKADLDQLLIDQQNPASPQYHHWLTPEEYAARFGVSQDDLDKIKTWLESEQLTIVDTARGRNWIAVSGPASQVEKTFGVELHHYLVNGVRHFANANEPTIPAALANVVGTIHGLTDFRLRARKHSSITPVPEYTTTKGSHYLAPNDVATIYNIKPLYDSGADASGQRLVVVGQTGVNLSDMQSFRSRFNIPGSDPQLLLIPGNTDPGILKDDEVEADLDLQWTSAVARNASIVYVYAQDVMDSVQYAIDQNLAPVLSMSYGLCEAQTPRSDSATLRSWAQQANAQGITWIAASGDSGATDCWDGTTKTPAGLSVDLPAAIPEVTGVGGGTFNEGTGSYWNVGTDANGASVLSYIPEMVWNDSNSSDGPASGGGGASVFFAKPSWQLGAGVPADGARDVPDITLSASADHDGYLMYSEGTLEVVGGTSVGAPVFAGLAALLNHAMVSNGASAGLGNMNPRLYSLAQTSPSAFHDITVGNNIINVTCGRNARNCTAGSFGFNAGVGYDLASGLGSLDAANLIAAWTGKAASVQKGTALMTLSAASNAVSVTNRTTLTATVTTSNGGTPTGTVSFSSSNGSLGTATLAGSTASLVVEGALLSIGADTIIANYSGDSAYSSASASILLNVTPVASGTPAISAVAHSASFLQSFAPGMILSVFGSQLAPTTVSAASVPLPNQLAGVSATINGIAAPLFYVSSSQLNIQIPYETPANSQATLIVNNNGQSTSRSFFVASVAPGIFAFNGAPVPNTSAARGQTVTLFITGAGAVTPGIGTGAGPAAGTPIASLPHPVQSATVTVGGTQAQVQFIGIPSGLVGVVQVNYTVPTSIATGTQPVVVSLGTVPSAPVNLSVQ
jgi:uncharacterized protein (TIGR03437 family)